MATSSPHGSMKIDVRSLLLDDNPSDCIRSGEVFAGDQWTKATLGSLHEPASIRSSDAIIARATATAFVHVSAASNSVRNLSELMEWIRAPSTSRSEGSKPETVSRKAADEQILGLFNSPDRREGQNRRTPLHHAAMNHHSETVRLLLDAGVNPLKTDGSHKIPLHHVLQEILSRLRQMQYSDAILWNRISEQLQLGLTNELCQSFEEDDGLLHTFWALLSATPEEVLASTIMASVDVAKEGPLLEMVVWLVLVESVPAMHFLPNPPVPETALAKLVRNPAHASERGDGKDAKDKGRLDMNKQRYALIWALLVSNASLDPHDNHGVMLLIEAVKKNDLRCVEMLLGKGASCHIHDVEGNTPLHWALRQAEASMDMIHLLLAHDANILQGNKLGATPVHRAAGHGHLLPLKLFLEVMPGCANVLAASNESPLHYAVKNGQKECVALLLERSASVNVVNTRNQRPIDLAGEDRGMIELLSSASDASPVASYATGSHAHTYESGAEGANRTYGPRLGMGETTDTFPFSTQVMSSTYAVPGSVLDTKDLTIASKCSYFVTDEQGKPHNVGYIGSSVHVPSRTYEEHEYPNDARQLSDSAGLERYGGWSMPAFAHQHEIPTSTGAIYANGTVTYGPAIGAPPLPSGQPPPQASIQTQGMPRNFSGPRYKTRLCMRFQSGKGCYLGSKCQFAHGEEELRVHQARANMAMSGEGYDADSGPGLDPTYILSAGGSSPKRASPNGLCEAPQISRGPGHAVSHAKQGVQHSSKIFVGGLPPSCDSDSLRAYFEQFGDVKDAFVMYHQETGQPRGFGFVTFDSESSTDLALQRTFHELHNKMVEVKRAVPKSMMSNVAQETSSGQASSLNAAAATSATKGLKSVNSTFPPTVTPLAANALPFQPPLPPGAPPLPPGPRHSGSRYHPNGMQGGWHGTALAHTADVQVGGSSEVLQEVRADANIETASGKQMHRFGFVIDSGAEGEVLEDQENEDLLNEAINLGVSPDRPDIIGPVGNKDLSELRGGTSGVLGARLVPPEQKNDEYLGSGTPSISADIFPDSPFEAVFDIKMNLNDNVPTATDIFPGKNSDGMPSPGTGPMPARVK